MMAQPTRAQKRMTCPTININGEELHKFACANGECDECKDSYKPFAYEAESVDLIKYCLYDGHHQCTWHGDTSIEQYNDDNGAEKYRCTKCTEMSEEERVKWLQQKKPAKVNTKKYKTKYSDTLKEFVKVGGVYHTALTSSVKLHRNTKREGRCGLQMMIILL